MCKLFTVLSLVLLCTATLTSPLYAASDRCPRHQVKTSLKGKLAQTRVYKSTSNSFSDYILGHHRGDSQILGFVDQSEIYTTLDYNFEVQDMGDNRYCVNLLAVKGYFYAAPRLYLPTDYKPGSCEYQQVYKHEKRHLKAVYDFHDRNTGKYASYLGRIARAVPVFPPVTSQADVGEVKQAIMAYFEGKFRTLEAKSRVQLNAIQAKIDSPQEYAGVQKRCKNW